MGAGRGGAGAFQIEPAAVGLPWPRTLPVVEVRRSATGDDGEPTAVWEPRADLVSKTLEIHANSVGHQRAGDEREFGKLFNVGQDPTLTIVASEDLRGEWVRVRLSPAGGGSAGHDDPEPQAVWMGYVLKTLGVPDHTSAGQTPRGRQRYTCVGPERLLEMCHLSASWWDGLGDDDQPAAVELGWMMGFNKRAGDGHIDGNRAAAPLDGCYNFGGSSVWTPQQMLAHLLRRYVQQFDDDGEAVFPIWTIGGAAQLRAAIEKLEIEVPMRAVETVRNLLDRIISPRYGIDCVIQPTEEGFEIELISLLAAAATGGGHDIPPGARYEIDLRGVVDMDTEFELCDAQAYDGVELVGQRIVAGLSAGMSAQAEYDLEALWTTGQASSYATAAGNLDPDANDAYRADDRFRDVYAAFRLDPDDWPPIDWPRCELDGELVSENVPGQSVERIALDWIPLRAGYDYTTDPPTYAGVSGLIPEFLPPLALIETAENGFVPVDQLAGVGYPAGAVSALRGEFGVRLNFTPNHVLARNHWSGNMSNFDPATEGLDYDDLVVTLAVRCDHRIRVGQMLPNAQRRGWGLIRRIEVPEAELHVLLPQTVVGVDSGGNLEISPNAVTIVRDDRELLKSLLAGALGRLLRERARASIRYHRLHPSNRCVGSVIEALNVGDQKRLVNAPITSVGWDFERGTTTLRAGQATR